MMSSHMIGLAFFLGIFLGALSAFRWKAYSEGKGSQGMALTTSVIAAILIAGPAYFLPSP